METFSLMIHGGAGKISDSSVYGPSLERICAHGRDLLASGASALDVVDACVRLLEDDELYNAGKGSVLTHEETFEMDAAIMDGSTLRAGAVAGVSGIRNPILLARTVMEKSEHVFLVADGAVQFAKVHALPFESDAYFRTEKRVAQLREARQKNKVVLDHSDVQEKKLGTVGAVACDTDGNLAAATSTGGIVNKRFGRVGDTPIIGAGTYAENATCAVSCTGFGEQFIRTVLAKTTASFIEHLHMTAQEAADAAISDLVKKVNGLGGLIVIDGKGNTGIAHSTPGILAARVVGDGSIQTWTG